MIRALILGIMEGNEAKRLIATDKSHIVYEESDYDTDGNEKKKEDMERDVTVADEGYPQDIGGREVVNVSM